MIPVNEPLLGGNELRNVTECIKTGWISSEGPYVAEFEKLFAARVGRRHGIAVANGSVALEAAACAIGIGDGDEVIMPTFTIISCAAAVVRLRAKPVLVDCDPVTWNMDVGQIAAKITARTKAIMVVHIYGLPVDLDPVLTLAKKHGLKILEDAAEVHGQTYRGRPCGSFGDVSVFSFYPNKHITTGEGGMIVTDDETIAERSRSLRNLCFVKERRFVHEELGWNFRMTNLQAALGLAQLERLDEFVERKRRMGRRYTELLQHLSGVQLPLPKTDFADNIYWVYGVLLKQADVDEVTKELAKRKIGTRPFFWCMHEQPVFRKAGWYAGESYPVAEAMARQGFYLPSGLALRDEQIDTVSAALSAILQR